MISPFPLLGAGHLDRIGLLPPASGIKDWAHFMK